MRRSDANVDSGRQLKVELLNDAVVVEQLGLRPSESCSENFQPHVGVKTERLDVVVGHVELDRQFAVEVEANDAKVRFNAAVEFDVP